MRVNFETKLQHKLMLAPRQQLFLTLVGMPSFELPGFLKKHVEANPFLEFEPGRAEGLLDSDVPDDGVHFDSLTEQLRLAADSPEVRSIGEYIIENLDGDGYMRKSVSEIAAALKAGTGKVKEALRIVQSLEPAGLGAADLRECLLLQIERYMGKDAAAYLIVRDCWRELVKREHGKIGTALNLSIADVRKETGKLKKFSSAPLKGIFRKTARRVVPEGRVVMKEGRYTVCVEEKTYPFIRINAAYEKELNKPLMSAREKKFLAKQLEQARILLRVLEERRIFLEDVFREIVEYQKGYLEGGTLLPLREKDIAEKKGVSISTVSRAVNRKYLETPGGMVKVRDFFSGSVGDSVSRHYVLCKIRDAVAGEKRPLSDREIAEKLAGAGIRISVRTVNKYRRRDGILNSYLRADR